MDQDNNNQEGNTLFIKNLPLSLTADQLESTLGDYGPVRRAFIVNDRDGNSRGFGYVEFAVPADAQTAASKINNKSFYGNVISAEIAKPKKKSRADVLKNTKKVEEVKESIQELEVQKDDESHVEVKKETEIAQNNEQQENQKIDEVKVKEEVIEESETKPVSSVIKKEPSSSVTTYTNKINEETVRRLQTVLVFGIPPQMKPENIKKKYPTVFKYFTYSFPCHAPFQGKDVVAELIVKDSQQIKGVVKALNDIEGLTAIRLSSIPASTVSFEHCRLIVRNMPFSLAEKEMIHLFSTVAPVHSVTIPKKNNKGTGFIFVQYYTVADATNCIETLNNTTYKNRLMIIDWSVNKNEYKKLQEEKLEAAAAAAEEEETEKEDENMEEKEDENMEEKEDENMEEKEEVEEEEEEEKEKEDEKDEKDEEKEEEKDEKDEEKEDEKEDENKVHPKIGDADEGKTIFVRNLSYDCTEKDLYKYFSKYGKIIYVKIVKDKVSGISKGNGFIKFETVDSVNRILSLYKQIQEEYASYKNKETDIKAESLLLDENRFIMNGRNIYIALALSNNTLKHELQDRDTYNKDKRHLYLMKEGEIKEGSPAAEGVPEKDMSKRANSVKEKNSKLKNPLFFISPFRLAIKNIGSHISAPLLKKICMRATQKALSNNIVDLNEGDPSLRTLKTDTIDIIQSVISTNKDSLDENGKPKHRGIGFVEFTKHHHALACLRILNNNPSYWWLCMPPKEGEEVTNLNDHKTKVIRKVPEGELNRPIVEFAVCNHALLKKKEDLKKEKESLSHEMHQDRPLAAGDSTRRLRKEDLKINKNKNTSFIKSNRNKKPYKSPFSSMTQLKPRNKMQTNIKTLSRATGGMKRKAGHRVFDRKKTRI